MVEETTTVEETTITVEQELNEKLQEKQYDSLQTEYMLSIYNMISENYDSYYKLYKMADVPDKDTYIRNHLIQPLENIGNLEFININSNEAQELLNSGFSIAWFTINLLGENEIVLLYSDVDWDSEYLYHEISHVQNINCVNNIEFGYINDKWMQSIYDIFIEGHATFHQQLVNNLYQLNSAYWQVSNSSKNTIFYAKSNGKGYIQYYNIYANLLLVAGYDVMEEISLTADISILQNALEEKYGKDIARALLSNIEKITLEDVEQNERYNSCVEFQNAMIDALCVKLDKLNNKEGIEDFLEFYKLYQYYLLPRVFETDDKYNTPEITYQVFNISKLEDKLTEKMLELGVIESKVVARVILYSSDISYGVYYCEDFKVLNLPISYKDIVVNSVKFEDSKYYVNINYNERLYTLGNINVDMEYVLDEDYNIIGIYNTNIYYN